MHTALRTLTATTLLLGLLATITPTATAQGACDGFEGFEDDANFLAPTGCWYTASGMGSSVVNTLRPYAGTKSLDVPSSGSPAPVFTFSPAAAACTDGVPFTASWFVNLDSLPSAGQMNLGYGAISTPASHAYLYITSGGAIGLSVVGSAGTLPALTIQVDTWYGMSLTVSCAAGSSNDVVYATAWLASDPAGTITGGSRTGLTKTTGTNTALEFFGASSGTFAKYFLDDIQAPAEELTPGSPFCANPSEANFGYDFVDDVEYKNPVTSAAISYEDAFQFAGTDSNSDMVAKGYNPGTTAFMVRFRIEADTEAGTSKFRVAFTTGDTVLTAGSAQDSSPSGADYLAAGGNNGEDSGNFDENIQVHFVENGNQWNLRAYYNTGAGLVQLPQTVNYGASPNNPTTFQVVVNSGSAADLPASIDGHTIPNIGDNVIGIQDGEGNNIFAWSLPGALFDVEWKDQWFIGQSTNAFGANTYIDDQEQQTGEDSTCVWDLIGTGTRTGSGGLVPGDQVPPPLPDDGADSECDAVFCPPEEGIGGLSSSALSLFLGIVIVASFAASMSSSTGTGAGGLAIFALLGVFIGYALGYIPLWVVLVLFTIGLGAIFLGFHNGGKSEGM